MFPLVNGYQINCAGNVGRIIGSLMRSYASPVDQYGCKSCEVICKEQQRIVDVPLDAVWSQYGGLESSLNEKFRPQNKRCPARVFCQDSLSTHIHELGSYLVLDTESAHVKSLYSQKQNVNGEKFLSDLSGVPVKLAVLGKTFVLVGAVNYYPPPLGTEIDYTALCRSLMNPWTEENDINLEPSSLRRQKRGGGVCI
ncbi:hypothetical protein QAD02_000484 [Eretmocerus hayati]|uniref:Uncharacterized protein n=1 Tax=Eretmocerus hayati TaxID=131215 RepID=A0ACC2NI39_9HYME|nr:hypothetical protein QAD02_000484 [Eretmocerus hayati]